MKRLLVLSILLLGLVSLFADLAVDIPFDTDIVGDDFSVVGPYVYESDWITVTNIGTTEETYTLFYSDDTVPTTPSGWYLSICRSDGVCFTAGFAAPITLAPQETMEFHIVINVVSTDGFPFTIILNDGDLPEPINLDFTFRTEDYVVSTDDELIRPKLLGNYPNPFNPATTIKFDLTLPEAADARIDIYNIKGQIVQSFSNLQNNSVNWNGIDRAGKQVDSGIYFYRLSTAQRSETGKMILLK